MRGVKTTVKSKPFDIRRALFIIGSLLLTIGVWLCFVAPEWGVLSIIAGGALYGAIVVITLREGSNKWQIFSDIFETFFTWIYW